MRAELKVALVHHGSRSHAVRRSGSLPRRALADDLAVDHLDHGGVGGVAGVAERRHSAT